MEYQSVKGKKLSFKGDKRSKQGKKDRPSSGKDRSKTKRRQRAGSEDECRSSGSGWVPISSLKDLDGPIAIYFRDEYVHVLSLPPKDESRALADKGSQPPALYEIEDGSLTDAEPSAVEQVLVGRKSVPMAGPNSAESEMYSFKACTGAYLSADRYGKVTCNAVAIGPLEMWTPVLLPDRGDGAVAFMINPPGTADDRFLSAEPQEPLPSADSTRNKRRRIGINTSATATGFCQVFTVKCQAALQRQRMAAEAGSRNELDTDDLSGDVDADEIKQAKRFQSFQDGRVHLSKRSRTELDEAKASGKYRETMASETQSKDSAKNIEELVREFRFAEVLNEDTSSKTIWLLGYINKHGGKEEVVPGENAAVVTLERLAVSASAIAAASAENSMALDTVTISSGEQNDIYAWANGFIRSGAFLPDLRVALIYPAKQKHINKHRRQEKRWIRETPALYSTVVRPFIDAEPASRIQWVYNILSKQAEADRIVFEDSDPESGFIVLPDLKWDGATVDSMYLVAIMHRRDVRSLRDLTDEHLPLLKNLRDKASVAAKMYGVAADQLRLYIHYQPSYYHFHVHITNVNFEGRGMLAGRAHLLDTVIDNIENIAPDYYQKATLSYALGSNDDLWPVLKDSKQ
ncbi:hypothetical protein GGI12_000042 [Dipsacomyces acuminosporus]|nr:hypothetical protein GGI12_000042 [Dipsacomyces acuminosporus]